MKIGVITFLLKELYTRCCSERSKENISFCKIISVLKWRYTIYGKYMLHRQQLNQLKCHYLTRKKDHIGKHSFEFLKVFIFPINSNGYNLLANLFLLRCLLHSWACLTSNRHGLDLQNFHNNERFFLQKVEDIKLVSNLFKKVLDATQNLQRKVTREDL